MICYRCGKINYDSAAEANRAVGRFKARRGHQLRDSNHAYYCDWAAAWHLGHNRGGAYRRRTNAEPKRKRRNRG